VAGAALVAVGCLLSLVFWLVVLTFVLVWRFA
jgi:hypothetical protein